MIDWREYLLSGDYNQMAYIEHDLGSFYNRETGNYERRCGARRNELDSMQDAIDWALDHEERVHNAHGAE